MNNDRINEIRARCEAATKGPYTVEYECDGNGAHKILAGGRVIAKVDYDKNAGFYAHAGIDLPWALDIIAAQQAEIDRLSKALEIAERGHVDCMSAERQADGKCLGYGRGENDDEPCEQCANCPQCTAHEPETKTIQEWAKLDGIFVYDPDGFDRSDPLLWEKEITKAEYLAGIAFCTVLPLPAAPKGASNGN